MLLMINIPAERVFLFGVIGKVSGGFSLSVRLRGQSGKLADLLE